MKDTRTGDTLTALSASGPRDAGHAHTGDLHRNRAQNRSDQEKLFSSLEKLAIEDPTFAYSENEDTGQLLISGMGELHLEIIVDRLLREFGVDVQTGKPQVVYKETITGTGKAHVIFDREIHDVRHVGEVTVSVEPAPRGEGTSFKIAPALETLPKELLDFMEQGAREGMLAECLPETKWWTSESPCRGWARISAP